MTAEEILNPTPEQEKAAAAAVQTQPEMVTVMENERAMAEIRQRLGALGA